MFSLSWSVISSCLSPEPSKASFKSVFSLVRMDLFSPPTLLFFLIIKIPLDNYKITVYITAVLRIQNTMHRIRNLLKSDLISKIFKNFRKFILYENRILPYYTQKSLLSENVGMFFWWFWSMFCSLRIRIRLFGSGLPKSPGSATLYNSNKNSDHARHGLLP